MTELWTIRAQLTAALETVDGLLATEQTTPLADSDHVKALPRTKAIEWVLERQDGPMRPVEIWAELHKYGRKDPKMEVQVTTYDLWERGRIGKAGRGSYVADSDVSPGGQGV